MQRGIANSEKASKTWNMDEVGGGGQDPVARGGQHPGKSLMLPLAIPPLLSKTKAQRRIRRTVN